MNKEKKKITIHKCLQKSAFALYNTETNIGEIKTEFSKILKKKIKISLEMEKMIKDFIIVEDTQF